MSGEVLQAEALITGREKRAVPPQSVIRLAIASNTMQKATPQLRKNCTVPQ